MLNVEIIVFLSSVALLLLRETANLLGSTGLWNTDKELFFSSSQSVWLQTDLQYIPQWGKCCRAWEFCWCLGNWKNIYLVYNSVCRGMFSILNSFLSSFVHRLVPLHVEMGFGTRLKKMQSISMCRSRSLDSLSGDCQVLCFLYEEQFTEVHIKEWTGNITKLIILIRENHSIFHPSPLRVPEFSKLDFLNNL